jgi:hypothetical protein
MGGLNMKILEKIKKIFSHNCDGCGRCYNKSIQIKFVEKEKR